MREKEMKIIKRIIAVFVSAVLFSGVFILSSSTAKADNTFGDYTYVHTYSASGEFITISKYTGSEEAVTIPDTIDGLPVAFIGTSAFRDNKDLKSITIPDGVVKLDKSAFEGCENLTNVTLPDSLETIGNSAFNYCTVLTEITIPNGVTSIGANAFYHTGITSITIPGSVTNMGRGAFWSCYGLSNVILSEGLTTIPEVAFNGCSSLTSITIPKSVTSIGVEAFRGCNSLASITLSEGLVEIGADAFMGCPLSNIIIPQSVTTIDDLAFAYCSGLKSISIPDGVRWIRDGAFAHIAEDYIVYTYPDTCASRYFDSSHIQYLYEEPDTSPDYMGFAAEQIVIAPNGSVLLSDYLNTNLALDDCDIVVSDNDLFFYDNDIIATFGEGSGTLTVSYGNLSATVELISTSNVIDTTGITLGKTELPLKLGSSELLHFTLSPENATNYNIVWSSSDESVATVNKGLIAAEGTGTATIIAKLADNEEIQATCEVTVYHPLKAISILEEGGPYMLQVGTTQKIRYYLYPVIAQDIELSFTSSDPDIISIDENGRMTALDNGTAEITITSKDISATVEATAYTPIAGLSLAQTSVRGSCGDKIQLTPIYQPENTTERDIIWSSNKEEVATVDSNGLVTVQGTGAASITATAGPYSATCSIVCNTHVWDEGRITTEPTCTEEGVKTFTCFCDETYTEVVPALGHSWNDFLSIDKEATCVEAGSKSIHCATCGESKPDSAEIIPATGHNWDSNYTIDKEASCTEEGSKSIHCLTCDEIRADSVETIPKLDHEYGEWEVTKEATCTETGSQKKVCSECGDTITEELTALGHDLYKTEAKAATCTEAGCIEYWTCDRCGKLYSDDKGKTEITLSDTVIAATGHVESDWLIITEATCTRGGSRKKECSVCGELLTEENIPAFGHSIIEHEAKAETFETNGNTVYWECVTCGKYFSDEHGYTEIEADEWIIPSIKSQTGTLSGWHLANGKWYYVSNATLYKGWLRSGTAWYYLDQKTGEMKTGWLKDGSSWYYMNSSGAMATGWVKDGDTWYYMNASGAMVTGWQKISGTWYFFKSGGSMAANEWYDGYWLNANGSWTYQPRGSWKKNSTGWWFGDTSGWYAKNESIKINDSWYTFNSAGYWTTEGWQFIDGFWYYYQSGEMFTGWKYINNNMYYFYPNGRMATNSLDMYGKTFYFNPSGALKPSSYKDLKEMAYIETAIWINEYANGEEQGYPAYIESYNELTHKLYLDKQKNALCVEEIFVSSKSGVITASLIEINPYDIGSSRVMFTILNASTFGLVAVGYDYLDDASFNSDYLVSFDNFVGSLDLEDFAETMCAEMGSFSLSWVNDIVNELQLGIDITAFGFYSID